MTAWAATVLAALLAAGCGFHVDGAGAVAMDDASGDGAVIGDAPSEIAIDGPTSAAPPFAMSGQRWLLPCTNNLGNRNCNCAGGVLTQTVILGGTSAQHWLVNARIRGVMEAIGYNGGTAGNGGWYVGGTKGDAGNNYYQLVVSSPAGTYWLNRGVPTARRSFAYDYMAMFPVDGGATITFNSSGQDSLQWGNYDAAGAAITFPGVTTTPDPYDGQFAQLDVIDAVPQ